VLTAVGVEQSTTNRLAFCEVTVTNQDQVTVGYFRGTVYRTTRPHVVAAVDRAQEDA
jgi:acyl-CoA thioesterase